MSEQTIDSSEILGLTSEIVSAHVANNPVSLTDLPGVIAAVHAKLSELSGESAAPEEPQAPAVSIKKSINKDYLVCLEDGRKLKMLKRHLATAYDMTPEEYRTKWGLPYDYPMVAPSYAEKRSDLAKKIGLGRKKTTPTKAKRK